MSVIYKRTDKLQKHFLWENGVLCKDLFTISTKAPPCPPAKYCYPGGVILFYISRIHKTNLLNQMSNFASIKIVAHDQQDECEINGTVT